MTLYCFFSEHMILRAKIYFKRKLKEYLQFVQTRKVEKDKRAELIHKFSTDKWKELPEEEKFIHTLSGCKVYYIFCYCLYFTR